MKEEFNPEEWLNLSNTETEPIKTSETRNPQPAAEAPQDYDELFEQVDEVVRRIEEKALDITEGYTHWRDIGFALADAFGFQGRQFFRDVSCFHPEYDQAACDKQFEYCLNANGQGISIKTFFHLAKQAGVDISNLSSRPPVQSEASPEDSEEQPPPGNPGELPLIPEEVYPNLPPIIDEACKLGASSRERDIILLGSLTALSSMMQKVYGLYDRKKVYPNLFLFVAAKASAGKGVLNHCRKLASPLHKSLREESKQLRDAYQRELNQYNQERHENSDAVRPAEPPEKMLFLPANSSATGVFQLLNDNDGRGLIFETEGDTLSNTFNTDYGNYSDGFRKAFQHESISYYRRTNREHVEIEKPRLSALLSGTPEQITELMPSTENGLFSRFMFYYFHFTLDWRDVFSNNGIDLDDQFERLGESFFELYKVLNSDLERIFKLKEEHKQRFNELFAVRQKRYHALLGDNYLATVRRMGLITFRMAMILSVLRLMETGENERQIICWDEDFDAALKITRTLMEHSQYIFSGIPSEQKVKAVKSKKERFYDELPDEFNRQKYLEIAQKLTINPKTAEDYIKKFSDAGLIQHPDHNRYIKNNAPEE